MILQLNELLAMIQKFYSLELTSWVEMQENFSLFLSSCAQREIIETRSWSVSIFKCYLHPRALSSFSRWFSLRHTKALMHARQKMSSFPFDLIPVE